MKLVLLSEGTSDASQQAIAAIVTSLSIAHQQAGVVYIASEPDAQREYFKPHLVTDVEQQSALSPFNQYQQLKQQSLCVCTDNDAVVVINDQLIEFGSPTWIFC